MVGKFIGSIPLVKEGQVDEFLQDSGKHIKSNAKEIEMGVITAFAEISNPETRVFIDRMESLKQRSRGKPPKKCIANKPPEN